MKPLPPFLYLVLSIAIVGEFFSMGHLLSFFFLALASRYPPLSLLCLSLWFIIVLLAIILIVRGLVLFMLKRARHEELPDRGVPPFIMMKKPFFLVIYVLLIVFALFVTIRGWRYGVFFDSLAVVNPITTTFHRVEVMIWIANLIIVLYFQLKNATKQLLR